MQISSSNIKLFREDFKQAMKALEQKHGVSIALGNVSYDSNMFRGKMTVTNTNGSKVETPSKKVPSTYTPRLGDTVKITHKKVDPSLTFTIIKVNNLTSKVKEVGGKTAGIIKVSNPLLTKV